MKNHLILSITLILGLLVYSCGDKKKIPEPEKEAIPVTVIRIQKEAVTHEISFSGHIEGNRTVKPGFMVAGRINFILPDEGQKVTKNQLIASLDPENYAIAKELADVQVAQVEDEFTRLKAMHETRSISDGDFAKISFGLQQAKIQQKLHTKNLAETKIYSPFNGVLLKKLAEAGEITGTGIPVAVISDISSVKVTAFVPENELRLIRYGQSALVKISSLDSIFYGKITEIGAVADPSARSFTIRIEVSNPKLLIRPGMIAEVTLPTDEVRDFISLPFEGIINDFNNRNYVFVVDETSGKAFRRDITIGKLTGNKVEIVSGLSENETIVMDGRHKLSDGVRIVVQK